MSMCIGVHPPLQIHVHITLSGVCSGTREWEQRTELTLLGAEIPKRFYKAETERFPDPAFCSSQTLPHGEQQSGLVGLCWFGRSRWFMVTSRQV